MKQSSVRVFAGATLAATLAVVTFGYAQELKPVANLIPKLPAPPALDAIKRTAKLEAALKGLGATQSPPRTLDTRLTPVAPKLSSGGQITRATTVLFNGSEADQPDGAFVLVRGTGMPISSVEMRVPTEAGKLYVYDCRMRVVGGTKLTVSRAGSNAPASVEDGHVIGAFAATSTSSMLGVFVAPSPGDTNAVLAHFYGCDIGKAS